ncbi:hypothetical protein [Thioalkalivibrio sp. HL-Eb18]|uniref:hypothetical protein n=1 Tax=Thioalkalivibrio sp. HL-Eb18 TaxID=1266913 RepID=UPI00036AB9AE|nr:hypothetical protein [Thioalkalivibrio sp. HL-Eb18]
MAEHHRDHQTLPVPVETFEQWMATMYDAAWDERDPVDRAAALAEMEHAATRRLLLAAFMAGAERARKPARLAALREAAEAANTAAFQGQAVMAVADLWMAEADAAGTDSPTTEANQ